MIARLALAGVLLVTAVACTKPRISIGVSVPVSELYPVRDTLRDWVDGELAAGRIDRAFYGLEMLETRRFAAERLAARQRATDPDATRVASIDLRPVFDRMFEPAGGDATLVASRGLHRVGGNATQKLIGIDRHGDELFWADQRLYQKRIETNTPYLHAVRGSFAVVTTEEARMMMAPDDLALSFFVRGDKVVVFAVRSSYVTARIVPMPARTLRAHTAALLGAASRPDGNWKPEAEALYAALLGPVEPELRNIHHLYVVPDGFLANVPFAILGRGGKPLIENVRVSYLPSLSVYRRLLMRQILDRPPSMLAVGNPAFSVKAPPLPAAEREARVVAGVFDESVLLTGAAARESRVVDAIGNANILHFATHGVLLGDQVPGGSSLLVAADPNHDGFLSAAEITELDLSHLYLAVLSACETSVGIEGESLDLASLTGAFLLAGTPTVIGSLWKVSDASTTELFLSFYSQFLERGAGDALRAAQLQLMHRPEFAHPYYWAAFVLYGWDK